MTLTSLLGWAAATLTTVSFLPQAMKMIAERKAEGVSLLTYCALSLGLVFWIVYGWILGAAPLVIANGVTLSITLIIVWLKLRFG